MVLGAAIPCVFIIPAVLGCDELSFRKPIDFASWPPSLASAHSFGELWNTFTELQTFLSLQFYIIIILCTSLDIFHARVSKHQ